MAFMEEEIRKEVREKLELAAAYPTHFALESSICYWMSLLTDL